MAELRRVLIANRGEIAIRVADAVADFGAHSAAVYARDDAASLHRLRADQALELPGQGPKAYLDMAALVACARTAGCDSVHPGYGFLAENAEFARACGEAGLIFVGPAPTTLAAFADKARARAIASETGVPVLEGAQGCVTLAEARDFFRGLSGAAMVIKAVAGGGGRGMRIVRRRAGLDAAYQACVREAEQAFGDGRVFVERFLERARHVEIQVLADASGTILHAGERDCTLQRRHQKLVEIAPCPGLPPDIRKRMTSSAIDIAAAGGLVGLATVEFLVDAAVFEARPCPTPFYFLEVNPRIQVEHTVTEEMLDIDLLTIQLHIASGRTFSSLGLDQQRLSSPRRAALQARINAERLSADGVCQPAAGTIRAFEMASGRGLRVDAYGYAGYEINPRYDSLLAKLIVSTGSWDGAALLAKARRALADCRVDGIDTNIAFLQTLLARPALLDDMTIGLVDAEARELAAASCFALRRAPAPAGFDASLPVREQSPTGEAPGADEIWEDGAALPSAPDRVCIAAPLTGVVTGLQARAGDMVAGGQPVLAIEAMKMVTLVVAPQAGLIARIAADVGAQVREGQPVFWLSPCADEGAQAQAAPVEIEGELRPDLAALRERRAWLADEARPEALARRRAAGRSTARELVGALVDPGTFVEYGGLAIAAQTRRRAREDLVRATPADGIITGIGEVNGATAGSNKLAAVLAYDYTVLAGTQGHNTHRKKDRLLAIAERNRLPVVLFSEGGGGRPGDTDILSVSGLDVESFERFARLSALVPLVGVNSGYCFAGNAALLGCCDVIISTRDSSIGMGGPALIEAGGLGVVAANAVGPMPMMTRNGVVDILVENDAQAVAAAKTYLGFFQGPVAGWSAPDATRLRRLLPADRVRTYDMRAVIAGVADQNASLELRADYGAGIITCLTRIEGQPVGLIASNPMHLGGAIDAPAADKAARFMQLCDAHALPILVLCDTPGFMVGPDSESAAAVRRFARMFVTGASLMTSVFAVVLRKAYGLGAMAMLAGQSRAPQFLVSWPCGEFGGMGLEGAIRLGMRKELAAIADPAAREAFFHRQVEAAYAWGKAENAAAHTEIDDVIDPADTRLWIAAGLRLHAPAPVTGKRRNQIDPW
jgi:acetyl/propionyl-CoA carboxylase alpha subunit/acetyl-CoA carboxylase carboxyltransferase component